MVVCAVLFPATLAGSGCKKIAEKVGERVEAVKSGGGVAAEKVVAEPAVAVSESEADDYVTRMNAALASASLAGVDALIDWQTMTRRSLADLHVQPAMMRAFTSQLSDTAQTNQLVSGMVQSAKINGVRYLRQFSKDGNRWVTLEANL